jgi:hypothetical protein
MVCKKNTDDLYWFGPRRALRPVGERSSVLSCTEVLVVGVTSGCERGKISQVSWCEWWMWVCATLLVTSQGSGELSVRVLCLCCYGGSSSSLFVFVRPFGMIPTYSFYSLKEVQGYKVLAYGVTFAEGA